MRTFQIVLVSLCIGLLGMLAIVVNLPKPAAPDSGYPMRQQIGEALSRAVRLADARNYGGALKLVDDANAFSNKTNLEVQQINQIHEFVLERQGHP